MGAFREELKNHPDKEFVSTLLHGLEYGMLTGINPLPEKSLECKNLQSALREPDIVDQLLQQELNKGYLLGPFDKSPFSVYRVNPIGIATGKYSGKKRLIVDLSSPHPNQVPGSDDLNVSLNNLIDKNEYSLSYVKVDDAIEIIQRLGPNCRLTKIDLQDAFKQIPIHPSMWPYHGVKWKGKYYFYCRLVFGSRSSPALYDQVGQAVCWIAKNNYKLLDLLRYLDDYLKADPCDSDPGRSMALLTMIFKKLGLPTSPSKCSEGEVIEFLGILLDCIKMEARLGPEKCERIKYLIEDYLARETCTKRELLSLIGHLSFATKTNIPCRSFISRLIFKSTTVKKLHHKVTLDEETKSDLLVWSAMFKEWNGISLFLEDEITLDSDFCLITDSASETGYGAYFQGKWFAQSWPDELKLNNDGISMAFQELFPIVMASVVFGNLWARKRLCFQCDNSATVAIINSRRSKKKKIMELMRRLVINACVHSFTFKAVWVDTKSNGIGDALSRCATSSFQMQRFRRLAPEADLTPTPVPDYRQFITI